LAPKFNSFGTDFESDGINHRETYFPIDIDFTIF